MDSDAEGLSFVAVKYDTAIVARVRIRSGEAALANGIRDTSAGGLYDLVVMDNFVYG